jgi:Rps23 Pro-64 3,4-dihydroxylase Tpa1-like proline 4-hydroxylase
MALDRNVLGQCIFNRLQPQRELLQQQWRDAAPLSYFVLDDVLPEQWAREIQQVFPSPQLLVLKRSLRETKYVGAQMNRYHPLLEESVYAFQMPEVVSLIESITGLSSLEPDSLLYAGGLSMMEAGHFLNPHVDNSHDKFRQRYRVLNLLFYVSPDWVESNGCNLELWPQGPEGEPITIVSRFNRLVVMVTHEHSWHSVSKNRSTQPRCCVSNYYFSSRPVGDNEYFHVTSFRGRPEQPVRDWLLRTDIWLRTQIRKAFPKGIKENRHFYDK